MYNEKKKFKSFVIQINCNLEYYPPKAIAILFGQWLLSNHVRARVYMRVYGKNIDFAEISKNLAIYGSENNVVGSSE